MKAIPYSVAHPHSKWAKAMKSSRRQYVKMKPGCELPEFSERDIDALEAIRALIQGEWDNEKLRKIGLLSTDFRENIRSILETYS
jgi:hypothetical protein